MLTRCFARRDQLWTNDGQYKIPEPGTEFPPDLAVSVPALFPSPLFASECGVCAIDADADPPPPPPFHQFYPEPNAGWMNEEGTRIDMAHRLVPKLPLRSALKRPRQVTI